LSGDNRVSTPIKLKIAIDGPAGAGKSTVARIVASKLGYLYIDTGAMFRAITWFLLQQGVDINQEENVACCIDKISLELLPGQDGRESQVFVNGIDVTESIRHSSISNAVPHVAAQSAVRHYLLQQQHRLCADGGVVMDGRDIGTVVMPDANVKIFLTAALTERAQRRWRELTATGQAVSLHHAQREIAARDEKDQKRTLSPLQQAKDAILLDTTGLSIDEVVDKIIMSVERVQRRRGI
jgi:cytidylate kinase